MNDVSYRIVRTLRCKNLNVPGTLGLLATAIGQAGAEVGNIETIHLGHHYTVRDIDIMVQKSKTTPTPAMIPPFTFSRSEWEKLRS